MLVAFAFVIAGLFTYNGLVLARGETPHLANGSAAPAPPITPGSTIKIMIYNIAKCFVHKGGLSFEDEAPVRERLDGIAALIGKEQPDLVFLSEAVFECGPCPIDQIETLARATDMHMWAYGENYNAGFPGYRIAGGNAILSRRALTAVANPDLPGRKPFYITKNNRRALWCAADVGGREVLLCSVHTDAFNPTNNLVQTHALLDFAPDQPTILAGDFNAQPGEPSIELIKSTGRFTGRWSGPVTFPSDAQTIDFIFVPPTWRIIEQRVIPSDLSDHYPVVATFEVRW